ncbi:hypothetical protein GOODEAATRI_014844, partial [Goodea atripinnis]
TWSIAPIVSCSESVKVQSRTRANQSPSYPNTGGGASSRTASMRPESFLYRLGDAVVAPPQTKEETPAAPPLVGEDAFLVEQLRKPKLTMAKCRRNVENFLEACRKIGVPQDRLCSVGDVLEGKGGGVYGTLQALLSLAPPTLSPSLQVQMAGFALFYLSVMSALCAIYVHLAPHA